MSERRFALFIPTHGRPDKVMTHHMLREQGYTGRIVVLVDDEDPTIDGYRERYGDEVTVFSKADYLDRVDLGDNEPDTRTALFARHAAFDLAREWGLTHLAQYDDDYNSTMHRWLEPGRFDLPYRKCADLDAVFDAMLDFLDDTGADCVAMGQGGDYIGGRGGGIRKHLVRKVMNTFFMPADSPIRFQGRMNDDVSAFVTGGVRGEVYLTVLRLGIVQVATQAGAGGMTDAYLDSGTYWKSMLTVIRQPSSVGLRIIKSDTEKSKGHPRIHHEIRWRNTVPMILSDTYQRR